MTARMTLRLFRFAALVSLTACAAPPAPPAPIMVGGDQDAHGCKASAGYSWSEVTPGCVRLWEAGIRLNDLINQTNTSSAFVILSPDGKRAELFLPSGNNSVILTGENNHWSDQKTHYTLETVSAGTYRVYDNSHKAIFGNMPPR